MYITSTSGYSTKPCTAQITKRKNRLKVYNASKSQVFLNDGEEFEIELFNPKTTPVLARISINGKRISERGVVLYPGQRVFLERFLDSPEKFKFSTYKVNNSKEVKEAIANNGLVKIEFYDEYQVFAYSSGITWSTVGNDSTAYPLYNNQYYTNNWSTANVNSSTCVTNISSNYNLTSSASIGGTLNVSGNLSGSASKRENSIETGRVEGGSKSDQSFSNTNGNFNSWTCNVVEYQIIPISEKPVEVSEIRNYCTGCGTRNKQGWKFCPTCGTKF